MRKKTRDIDYRWFEKECDETIPEVKDIVKVEYPGGAYTNLSTIIKKNDDDSFVIDSDMRLKWCYSKKHITVFLSYEKTIKNKFELNLIRLINRKGNKVRELVESKIYTIIDFRLLQKEQSIDFLLKNEENREIVVNIFPRKHGNNFITRLENGNLKCNFTHRYNTNGDDNLFEDVFFRDIEHYLGCHNYTEYETFTPFTIPTNYEVSKT